MLDDTLKSAKEMIRKGYRITLLDGRAYAFRIPIAMTIVDIRFWLYRRSY